MRISFPNKERDDTLVGTGEIRVGSAPDNTIVLESAGVAEQHLRLRLGDRGIELHVLTPHARTHVNTRPVREKAILRLGDMLSLGAVQIVLKPDHDADIRTDIWPETAAIASVASHGMPPPLLLRGLSGMYFGKIVPVRDSLVVGCQGDLILDSAQAQARQATIELLGDAIALRSLTGTYCAKVNGVDVRDAILMAGDQLCFGRDRFLIEAPSLPLRPLSGSTNTRRVGPSITQTLQAISLPDEEQGRAPFEGITNEPAKARNDIWWLIAAAAVIAAGLAGFFLGVF